MTTFTYQGKNRIYFGARAYLLEGDREVASDWASKFIQPNPALGWIVGKFVEAEKANNNQQYFTMDGLRMGQPTIAHSPMNVNHSARNIVGAYVATEMVYPNVEEAGEDMNPFIESLGVFWKYYFPDEYRQIARAHDEGKLFFSMECVPRAVQTVGGSDDSIEYAYEGVTSPNYPDEINERKCAINLVDPHFVGGALIIPPKSPGWSNANVTSIANFMKKEFETAEAIYEGVKSESPHLDAGTWESLMAELVTMHVARDFSGDQRKKLADKGQAMPDGSFPIANTSDLKNAIRAIGRAKDPAAAKAHIKKRAKALGATDLLPEDWQD